MYLLLLSRCGGGSKLPDAKDRAGAPVTGGFPSSKYPVNVLVDGRRAHWLPDDWAQVLRAPVSGGRPQHGYMSPDGKFVHRKLSSHELFMVSRLLWAGR